MTPKVSVVVPTYNCGSFLPATLDSVFNQTLSDLDFELIVVDDGSTDNTEEIIRPYLGRATYLRGPNRGAAAARNEGLKISQGELVALLDADDVWHSEKLDAQVNLMDAHPEIGVCYTNFVFSGGSLTNLTGFDERNSALLRYERRSIGDSQYLLTSANLLRDFLVVQAFPKPSMLMMRRSCFERAGHFDESLSICEDTQMCLRLARYFKFAYIDRPLVQRRVRTDTLASSADNRRYTAVHIQMFEELEKWISLSASERRILNRTLANYRLAAGYLDFSEYRLSSSRRQLWDSFKASWTFTTLLYLSLTLLPVEVLKALRMFKQRLN